MCSIMRLFHFRRAQKQRLVSIISKSLKAKVKGEKGSYKGS
jgi:hypothetical protein